MDFNKTIEKYSEIVNKQINDILEEQILLSGNKILCKHEIFSKQFLTGGGKRLRPIIMIMAYKSFCADGKQLNKLYRASASVEFLHNYTLMLDDIMDGDKKRREKLTFHELVKKDFDENNNLRNKSNYIFSDEKMAYASSITMCMAEKIHSIAEEQIINSEMTGKEKALKILIEANEIVNDGQIMDVFLEYKKDATEKEYMQMIDKKTANLIAASAKIGAVFAGANEKQIKKLAEYARGIGLAFQIQDDALDIDSNSKKGNTYASDIRNKKNTLLIIKAKEKYAKEINAAINKKQMNAEDIRKIVYYIEKSGAREYCIKKAKQIIEKAKSTLKKIEMNSEQKQFFYELADYMIKRDK